MKKIGIVYHQADMDGVGSYHVIASQFISDKDAKVTPIPWDYGNPVPNLLVYDRLYIVDICLPSEDMKAIHSLYKDNAVWIDHHKTANEKAEADGFANMKGIRSPGRPSAVALCLKHIGEIEEEYPGIMMLSAYDTWDKEKVSWEHVTLPSQAGFKAKFLRVVTQFDTAETGYFMQAMRNPIKYITNGEAILKSDQIRNSATSRRAFTFTWKGIAFIVVNQGEVNSTVAEAALLPHEAIMIFKYDGSNNNWVFSLYGIDDSSHNLSVIAKEMGGGGHAKACGFTVKSLSDVFGTLIK